MGERARDSKEALKYKTKTEFSKGCSSALSAARRNGWVDEICSHMDETRKPAGYWTLERCRKEALKYKTKTEFSKGCVSAYQAALRNGWLDEVCAHMKGENK